MTERSLVIVVLSALCITMILAVPTNSLVGYYDPWLDYDDNGDIDMKDVAASARAFGSLGDPTKYVNVTNWPTSSQVCVWYRELMGPYGLWSSRYESFGFCRLHILAWADDLISGESVEVRVHGRIHDETGFNSATMTAYTITLTATSYMKDATIFVPSEKFYFSASGYEDSFVSVNFYLTWA